MKDRRARYGEKYWFYTCGEGQDQHGNPSPYIGYHRPYIAPRLHSWYAWQLEADGMLIFAISQVPEENVKPKEREKQWPQSEWVDGYGRGCGVLIYPGPDFQLIPGMRLASVRDGLEDYEYFERLHRLSARVDPEEQKGLLDRIRKELTIEADILNGEFTWTRDVRKLEEKRARLAALIEEVQTTE
jgi:hypothetical protein